MKDFNLTQIFTNFIKDLVDLFIALKEFNWAKMPKLSLVWR